MARVMNFYMDDSGTRKPDRAAMTFDPARPNHFALGGVLILEEEEAEARAAYDELRAQWSITYPLHSVAMRHAAGDFCWLRRDSPEYEPFMRDLTRMLTKMPVTGLACVIDRPGHDARYRPIYGRNQWQLCKTAFSIVVERAAKHARLAGCKLRVLPERSCRDDERRLEAYYEDLRTQGLPFDPANSKHYAPLGEAEFSETLVELRFKAKSSPMVQIADLYLWPIAMERYGRAGRPYEAFRESVRLIECYLHPEQIAARGSKYSCFGLVDRAA